MGWDSCGGEVGSTSWKSEAGRDCLLPAPTSFQGTFDPKQESFGVTKLGNPAAAVSQEPA
jgi:hypothetical protein